MYKPEKQDRNESVCLLDQIKADPSGALRDSLLSEMRAAEDEIHASLAVTNVPEECATLRALLAATELAIIELGQASNELRPSMVSGVGK